MRENVWLFCDGFFMWLCASAEKYACDWLDAWLPPVSCVCVVHAAWALFFYVIHQNYLLFCPFTYYFWSFFWAAIRHWNREWDSIIIQCDEISFLNTAPYLNRNPFHSTSPFWYDICGYYLGKRNALKNTKFSSKHVHTHTHTIIIKI